MGRLLCLGVLLGLLSGCRDHMTLTVDRQRLRTTLEATGELDCPVAALETLLLRHQVQELQDEVDTLRAWLCVWECLP
jgi:hypothetical protein